MSVIEALLHDFVIRLSQATGHFPSQVTDEKRKAIKASVESKNYNYSKLIKVVEKHGILDGSKDMYKQLKVIGRFRNRVHIVNWHQNFEKDESTVFNARRLEATLNTLIKLNRYLSEKYPRP